MFFRFLHYFNYSHQSQNPRLMCCTFFFIYFFLHRYEKFQNKCYKLFFCIALMAYPSASTRSLRIYQCDPIGAKYYLARDLSIECFDGAWSAWSAWSGLCIAVYVIGIPLGFFILLHSAINRNLKQRWLECQRNHKKLQSLLKEAEIDAALTRRTYYKPTNARERKSVAIHYLRIHNMHHHKTIEQMGCVCFVFFIYFFYFFVPFVALPFVVDSLRLFFCFHLLLFFAECFIFGFRREHARHASSRSWSGWYASTEARNNDASTSTTTR